MLSLGGTISATKGEGPGVAPALTGEELVGMVPEISSVAEVEAAQLRKVAGSELTLEDAISLAREVEAHPERVGIVVTQGTDSIEETAFALDLLVDREAPLVVTGAMRDPTLPGADGPANLLAAVRVAAGEEARGFGVVVVMNDEIHAARFVRKAHAQNPAAFSSAPAGPVGYLYEGRPRVVVRSKGRRRRATPRRRRPPRRPVQGRLRRRREAAARGRATGLRGAGRRGDGRRAFASGHGRDG